MVVTQGLMWRLCPLLRGEIIPIDSLSVPRVSLAPDHMLAHVISTGPLYSVLSFLPCCSYNAFPAACPFPHIRSQDTFQGHLILHVPQLPHLWNAENYTHIINLWNVNEVPARLRLSPASLQEIWALMLTLARELSPQLHVRNIWTLLKEKNDALNPWRFGFISQGNWNPSSSGGDSGAGVGQLCQQTVLSFITLLALWVSYFCAILIHSCWLHQTGFFYLKPIEA